VLNVSPGYVVKWNGGYKKEGIRGLRLRMCFKLYDK
jgi:hypothetical protein